MSTVTETQDKRERSWLYITCLGRSSIALVVGGLIAFSSAQSTAEANDKADQLITELKAAGARAPDKDQIVRVLGDDGGATCADPNDALSRTHPALAAHERGRRPGSPARHRRQPGVQGPAADHQDLLPGRAG